MAEYISSDGYFTMLKYLFEKSSGELEEKLGYSQGSLSAGWKLLLPSRALEAGDIDLKGSTRYSNGVMSNGNNISQVLADRLNVDAARSKVAEFFHKSPENRPAKVLPNIKPAAYPPARPVGIPQFKLLNSIDWRVAAVIPPGRTLPRKYFI